MPQSQVLNGPNPPTTYLITDLQRLTMYSIFVYATNAKGRGVDSDEMNISSTAVGEFDSLIVIMRRVQVHEFEPHMDHIFLHTRCH